MRTERSPSGNISARLMPERYTAVRAAMLRVLPSEGAGLTLDELRQGVTALLPPGLLPQSGSVGWYVKAVQLDLEARGLIAPVSGSKPLRLRRTAPGIG